MQLILIHPKTRQKITIPSTQVVVCDDFGRPLAISYEATPGTVIHSDLNDPDFPRIMANLGLKTEKPELFDLNKK